MENSNFLMAKDPENDCRDLIFHRDSDFRMRVICADTEEWVTKPHEVQLFADNHGERLLFETVGYDSDEPALIIEAIQWYANYIGNPELEIEAEVPRG
jgi:hypothetical protein